LAGRGKDYVLSLSVKKNINQSNKKFTMKKNLLITIGSLFLLIGMFIFTANNRSAKVEESTQDNESVECQIVDSILKKYIEVHLYEMEELKEVIANFYKYKSEDSLFVGIEYYSFLNMQYSDTLLIFNFEQGTVKKVKREDDRNVNYSNYIKGFPREKTVTGDFNGDGRKETLRVENYELLLNQYDSVELKREINGSRFMYFKKEHDFYFTSSDKRTPNLEVFGTMDFTIKNLGDIDGDSGDEIGFLYGKTTSNIHWYRVFTLKNNRWKILVKDVPLTYDMRSTGIIPVEKDPKHKGVLLIRSMSINSSYYSAAYVIEESWKVKRGKKVFDPADYF
jgi:hypothetical protein